jgi:transcriptional regulator with PAS, ATPase and Fis domain
MSEERSQDASAKRERRLAKHFRWQALFERCAEPLFVLDRRGRLLFVNRAWEKLTGVKLEEAHVLICRRHKPLAADDSPEDILAHALTPPLEVRRGVMGRVRRMLPGPGATRSWEIEFLPLLQEGEQGGYLLVGRIRPLDEGIAAPPPSLSEKLMNLRQRRIDRFPLDDWNSSLPAMQRLVEQARLAGRVTTPVLLVGETGTGKQTLARTIHFLGSQREQTCAFLDCEYVPPAALAALLFGPRGGREYFAAVYLREPASLPRDLQLRLFEMIRNTSPEGAAGVRVFAGCRQNPEQAVREGRLLEELACALGTLVLDVPPLRERQADLPALVERLLERACFGRETRVTALDADAWDLLRNYAWPGNVRELYNVLRFACDRATGPLLRAADLPSTLRRAFQREQTPPSIRPGALPLEQLLEEAERRLIQLALQRAGGKKAAAARLLSIPRPRLWRRMLKLGIVDTEGPEEGVTGLE